MTNPACGRRSTDSKAATSVGVAQENENATLRKQFIYLQPKTSRGASQIHLYLGFNTALQAAFVTATPP